MKLGISTFGFFDRIGVYETLKIIKNAGFDCVDFGFGKFGETFGMLDGDHVGRAVEVRKYIDELGLECEQTHAPYAMLYGESFDASAENYLKIVRSMEFSAILGAEYIVVHPIVVPKESGESEWFYNQLFYKSLETYCERFGIKIAVENMFHTDPKRNRLQGRLNTPEELCRFIRELDSPNFVACFDVGHAALTGLEPEDFLAGMERNLLKVIHVHDCDYQGDRHTLPYLGKINWDAVMRELKKLDYDGAMNFEIFRYVKRIPEDLLDDALQLSIKVGKRLVNIFECS